MVLRNLNIKYLTFFILFCTVNTLLFSQKNTSSSNNEKQVYTLESNKKTSKEIIKEKDDKERFFYEHFKLGVHYYELKNYRLAEVSFKKALTVYSQNDVVKEYLYFCYVFTGRNESANKLTLSFSPYLKEKLKIGKKSTIDFVMVEVAKTIVNSDYSKENSETYFENAAYRQIGLKHYINNKFALFHSATYFGQETYTGKVVQMQYYTQAVIPLKNNWLIAPAMHIINTNFEGEISLEVEDVKSTSFVGSLAIAKDYKKWSLGLGTTYSTISETEQISSFTNIIYYPFGNSKLALGVTGYLHPGNNYNSLSSSFAPFVYFMPTIKSFVKLSYLNNTKTNLIEQNGYLVNNSFDLTKSRFNVLASYTINNTLSVYSMFQIENKENEYNTFDYKNRLFLLGVKIGIAK